ncbi:MAG: hypothetical protein WBC04_24830 [Candidatus Acidiferrales bacterium]
MTPSNESVKDALEWREAASVSAAGVTVLGDGGSGISGRGWEAAGMGEDGLPGLKSVALPR